MNKFLQYIPGFRSNVLWKKATASVYYLFCLLMLTVGFDAFLFFASIPFVVFSLVDLIQRNKKGIPLKRALIPFVLSLAIVITGLSMSPTTEDTKGPELSSPIAQEYQTQTQEQPTNAEVGEQLEPEIEENKPVEQEGSTSEAEKSDASEKSQESSQPTVDDESSNTPGKPDNQQKDTSNVSVNKKLKVHFIDVGQADSILIQTPDGKSMLIDAGNNADGQAVVSYLKGQGVSKIDILVGTHPHEDHIGGMDNVINSFEIGQIYMPKVSHTTKTYEDVLTAISRKGLKITSPTPGSTFSLGEVRFTILAPNSSTYEDMNDYSIVLKMEYGNTSFLFTGDAEQVSENEIIAKGYNLKADVLKVGHHGSSSSTSQAFLDKVSPKYAVIMVGSDNNYGHPHKETMDKLEAKGIPVYRTDENGTIVATSDGNNITFNTQPGSYTSRGSGSTSSNNGGTTSSNSSSKTTTSGSEKTSSESSTTVVTPSTPNKNNADRIVYWTPKGKSYHFSKDCPTLSRSKTILSGPLSECPKSDPCDRCTY